MPEWNRAIVNHPDYSLHEMMTKQIHMPCQTTMSKETMSWHYRARAFCSLGEFQELMLGFRLELREQREAKNMKILLLRIRCMDRKWMLCVWVCVRACADIVCEHYRVRVIWKILYPAMNEASLVRLCFPEPPTPTNKALPLGVRIILDTYTHIYTWTQSRRFCLGASRDISNKFIWSWSWFESHPI